MKYDSLSSLMETTEKKMKIYEVGYLVLPSVPEEHIPAEVSKIKASIEKGGGVFITEDFPKLRPLAYTMRKNSGGRNLKHDSAYFGWVKFEASSGEIAEIKAEITKNENILRFMIVETVRENTMFVPRMTFRKTEETGKEGTEKEEVKMTEEEMEKTIENLVVE